MAGSAPHKSGGCRVDTTAGVVVLSQRFWKAAVQIVSKHPCPRNGGLIYSFMFKRNGWIDGAILIKAGDVKSRSDNHTQTSLDLRYLV